MANPDIRVGMLIVMQPDLEKAVEFYTKLGFDCGFHLPEKWAEFSLGNARMGLCPTSAEPVEHHTGIILEVPNVHEAYADFKEKGVEFLKEPFEAIHGIMCSFKDPGGNIFDLYQPTPEKVEAMAQKIKEKHDEDGCLTAEDAQGLVKEGSSCCGSDGSSCGTGSCGDKCD